jgi:superfamily II DNA or RNA helicase
VLAQRTAHVDHLAEGLAERGHQPVVLKGGMGVKARANAMARLRDASHGPLLAVATGSLVGEGFDCPVLDTLFLAWPVSFKGRLIQYAGRVLRSYPGKTTAEVHDYYDVEVPVLAAALAKRAPGYVSLGFPDPRRGRAS